MKKRLLAGLAMGLFMMWTAGLSEASLTTIGTATYGGSEYNLIYDDDNNGQGLVWLDYSHKGATSPGWQNQVAWTASLNDPGVITYNLSVPMNWTGEWRLPATVDGLHVYGYEGDPDGDGVYTYTAGYNLANSEMGHLYYTELGNLGYRATDGTSPQPGWGLGNTGDFDNLIAFWYWSGTEYAATPGYAWALDLDYGIQDKYDEGNAYGLAVRPGQPVPVPGAVWLFGSGLIGLASVKRLWKGNRH